MDEALSESVMKVVELGEEGSVPELKGSNCNRRQLYRYLRFYQLEPPKKEEMQRFLAQQMKEVRCGEIGFEVKEGRAAYGKRTKRG